MLSKLREFHSYRAHRNKQLIGFCIQYLFSACASSRVVLGSLSKDSIPVGDALMLPPIVAEALL